MTHGPAHWPDERIWNEIRLRTGDPSIESVVVHDKEFVPLRSVAHYQMQQGRLFLAGDAARLVRPTVAKGMNLALFDVGLLAQALVSAVRDGDADTLANYSDTMHDAVDWTLKGAFRRMAARARLDELFSASTAGRLHSDYRRGLA